MLNWETQDFERKFWFAGKKMTDVSPLLSLIFGTIFCVAFYAILHLFKRNYVTEIMTELGWVPYAIAFTFFWGICFLFIKWRKLVLQRQALTIRVVPLDYSFVLSVESADRILENLYKNVLDPERFMLFNRILRALSNLKNLGRVPDIEVIIRTQSDIDHNSLESSYSVLRGMIWAMPVLGFIGTVQGLSLAIGGFGAVLAGGGDISNLRGSLQGVVGGLSVSFGTTLLGLLGTLCLQMMMVFLRKSEEEFHERCDDYCHRNIVSKLRLNTAETEAQ